MRNIATTFLYFNVLWWNIQRMEMFQTKQTPNDRGFPNIAGSLGADYEVSNKVERWMWMVKVKKLQHVQF
jgi:hypothetical protein